MISPWAWIAWVALSLTAFAILEGIALTNRVKGDTLSENLQRLLGVVPAKPWRRFSVVLFSAAVFGFAAWFVDHIAGS